MSRADHARAWALSHLTERLGQVYVWGDRDCSKIACDFMTEAARVGWVDLYDGMRRNAAALDAYLHLRGCMRYSTVPELRPGMLVFYARDEPESKPHHVAIHVATLPSGVPECIEAGGAGSKADSYEHALRESGSVRRSDSNYHGAGVLWWARDPFALVS